MRRRGGRTAEERGRFRTIELDYSVAPRPRWGHGAPSHEGIRTLIEAGRDRYHEHLRAILELREPLLRIPARSTSPGDPVWANDWLPGLDAAALYAFLARTDPEVYLEVGSGNSTKFVRRAIEDHGLRTRLVSIDPQPRAEIDALCDEVIRSPAEEVDVTVYDRLDAGDVLFVDNSHRCLQNSDATVMFLEVLPRLRPGVLVEFHDIMLPDDYPPEWAARFYSEQYLLAAFLLGGDRLGVELPNHFVARDPELGAVLAPLWCDPAIAGLDTYGASFWIRTR
jgi:Methyltransferase domain